MTGIDHRFEAFQDKFVVDANNNVMSWKCPNHNPNCPITRKVELNSDKDVFII